MLANVLIEYLRVDFTDAADEIIAAESLGVFVAYNILKFQDCKSVPWDTPASRFVASDRDKPDGELEF